jgi:site-specific recombinase XerD
LHAPVDRPRALFSTSKEVKKMKGTRPLSTEEIIAVSNQFTGTFEVRNRSLFMLGVSVGGRISELLALKISDVWQNGQPVSDLLFQKRVVKGKETARMIPVNGDGQQAIIDLIHWHQKYYGNLDPRRPLFLSRQGGEALSRSHAHRILEAAFRKAGLNGKLATHSLRKTFAQRCYDACGDIHQVSELLGHKNIETTKRYIGISYTKLQETVQTIEIYNNRTFKTLHSVSISDLITELQARGVTLGINQEERQPKKVATAGSKVITFPPRV